LKIFTVYSETVGKHKTEPELSYNIDKSGLCYSSQSP
jgi:hypothetical protein